MPVLALKDLCARVILLPVLFIVLPCFAQKGKITIHQRQVPYKLALETAARQSGYNFAYSDSIFFDWPRVDLDLSGVTILEFIGSLFAGMTYDIRFNDRTITISRVPPNAHLYADLKGRVLNTQNEPMPSATVSVVGKHIQAVTKDDGSFILPVNGFETMVTITYSGYLPLQIRLSNRTTHNNDIVLQRAAVNLNEVEVEAYGQTTQRLSTGTISTLKGDAIRIQPVTNVLDVLAGQIPGLSIRRTNGVSGSTYEALLGGRHSIAQGNEPLFVIDGVPLAASSFIGTIGPGSSLGNGGASTLNGIPPGDIASVSVLRGPAATAIYGSRAANGVILITLKEGASGPVRFTADVSSGVEHSVKVSRWLNTSQFLSLREEAVRNDGKAVDATTIPELGWGSSRQTDYQHLVLGHTGYYHDIRVGLSGGSEKNYFLVSGTLHAQNTIFPGATKDVRESLYGYWHYKSDNSRLRLTASGLYSKQDENLPLEDLTNYQGLAPNAPAFADSSGHPVWTSGGLRFINIPALTHNTYQLGVYNFLGHLQAVWQLKDCLSLESSLGVFHIGANEEGTTTIAGQDPNLQPPPTAQSDYSRNDYQSSIAEGLARYSARIGPGLLEAILGGTWQGEQRDSSALTISGYPNDLLLATGNGGTDFSYSKEKVDYHYLALFSRVKYSIGDRYILESSARRDGSSRWGPGHQFGTFWSMGGAWLFSKEAFFEKWRRVFSFGKLRGSYGTTGNDQTGDNQFAQIYNPVSGQGGRQGVVPGTLYNPDLHWERSYALELGLELGLLRDKVFFSATGYRSVSGDQILASNVAGQAGGVSVVRNMPVRVNNESLELSLRTSNQQLGPVRWTSTINLTLARNKLTNFPGLAGTSYASTLEVGKSLTVSKGLHYIGVDKDSGLYRFRDVNGDGKLNADDVVASPSRDPRYYGSWANGFGYKGWRLDVVATFCVQRGENPLVDLARQNPPGMEAPSELSNGPVEWLDHWRKRGDNALQQRLTTGRDQAAVTALGNYLRSDANAIDASYLRVKTLSLSYQVGEKTLHRWGLANLQFYLRAQDPWTFTHYPVWDPETQNPLALPPARTWVAGFSLKF
jgi:TonB-linked SusC/RagA family outer membrane protein